MKYIRVAWKQKKPEYPIMFYSEFNDERLETRKIAIYLDGKIEYASTDGDRHGTVISEFAIPELEEIAQDAQFEPFEITREEFEVIWAERKQRAR